MEEYEWAQPYLAGGEYIIWQGRPEKGGLFTRQEMFMIPFSLVWCGFAIYWEITAVKSGAPLFFKAWGMMFVLMGLYLVFGRFITQKRKLDRARYVITDKKIMLLQSGKMEVLDRNTLPPLSLSVGKDGKGTINIGMVSVTRRNGAYSQQPAYQLRNIAEVSRVWELLTTQLR